MATGNFFMFSPLIIFAKKIFGSRFSTLSILLTCILLAGTFELIQFIVPGRVPDFMDFYSNVASLVLGILLLKLPLFRPGR